MKCVHCGNLQLEAERVVTTDFEPLCEECAIKSRDQNEEWMSKYGHRINQEDKDEDGDPINEATPTDVPPGA